VQARTHVVVRHPNQKGVLFCFGESTLYPGNPGRPPFRHVALPPRAALWPPSLHLASTRTGRVQTEQPTPPSTNGDTRPLSSALIRSRTAMLGNARQCSAMLGNTRQCSIREIFAVKRRRRVESGGEVPTVSGETTQRPCTCTAHLQRGHAVGLLGVDGRTAVDQ